MKHFPLPSLRTNKRLTKQLQTIVCVCKVHTVIAIGVIAIIGAFIVTSTTISSGYGMNSDVTAGIAIIAPTTPTSSSLRFASAIITTHIHMLTFPLTSKAFHCGASLCC